VVAEALAGLRVEGVDTNRELLASVLAHQDFAEGAITTRWLEEAAVA
jgi:biotin carboxylase